MAIWNDERLVEWASSGGVSPYDAQMINPASINLRLGNKIRFPHTNWRKSINWITMKTPGNDLWGDEIIIGDAGVILPVGGVALCCSLEYITMPEDACGTLMSRSGTGRRLLEHLHAGFFDPGFYGYATFEFKNEGPWDILLEVGTPLVQLKMEQMNDYPKVSYRQVGHYNGQSGATFHKGVL